MDEASTSKRVREEVSLFTEGDGAGTVKDCKTAMACFFIQILPSQKHQVYLRVYNAVRENKSVISLCQRDLKNTSTLVGTEFLEYFSSV